MPRDPESATSKLESPRMAFPSGSARPQSSPRFPSPALLEVARRLGPDILVAISGCDPASDGQRLFFPPSWSDAPASPIRVQPERSLLPHLLKQRGPRIANDLAHPTFEEERILRSRDICAYVAVPLELPGWDPAAAMFASRTVRRFDAITVAALLRYIEESRPGDSGSSARLVNGPRVGDEKVTGSELQQETVIGESPEFLEICRLIAVVARRDTTVLVQGESGTGKELIAKTIHRYSRRAERPFVRVNCAALTETLIESEMFGHKKGAFTGALYSHKGRFEVAHGGTLLLDEIGNMSLSGQAKLLRVLQEREFEPVGQASSVQVDVRVIATTNVNLEKAIAEGAFRQDLYFRLAVVPLTIPPLRVRRRDIIPLAEYFLAENRLSSGRSPLGLSAETRQLLERHDWPGNARELRNAIEYAVLVGRGAEVCPEDLPRSITARRENDSTGGGISLRSQKLRLERELILEAMQRAGGVKKEVARLLGIDPRNLGYLLRKHTIR